MTSSRVLLHLGQLKSPPSGGCDAKAVLVVCALTLVADDQRSASRAMIAYFTVIVSGTPKLKKRFKGLVACLNSGDHVLAYLWVDIRMKVVRDQGESQFSGGKPVRMPRGGTVSSLGVSSGSKLKRLCARGADERESE